MLPEAADHGARPAVVGGALAMSNDAAFAVVPGPALLVMGHVARGREGLEEAQQGRREGLVLARAFDDEMLLGHHATRPRPRQCGNRDGRRRLSPLLARDGCDWNGQRT